MAQTSFQILLKFIKLEAFDWPAGRPDGRTEGSTDLAKRKLIPGASSVLSETVAVALAERDHSAVLLFT
jgi:hypothetical protein